MWACVVGMWACMAQHGCTTILHSISYSADWTDIWTLFWGAGGKGWLLLCSTAQPTLQRFESRLLCLVMLVGQCVRLRLLVCVCMLSHRVCK